MAGRSIPARIPIIAITTSSSIRVKALILRHTFFILTLLRLNLP
jgi:hypothetical protein